MVQIFEIRTNNLSDFTTYFFPQNFRQQNLPFDQQNVSKPFWIRNMRQQSTNTNPHK